MNYSLHSLLAAQLAEQRAARRAAPLAPSKRAVHQMGLGPLGPSFAPWECSSNTALQIAVQLTAQLAMQLSVQLARRAARRAARCAHANQRLRNSEDPHR